MSTILLVIHVLVAITLIGIVLIQHGKGADAGAALGSGASATVFGSQGSGSFMTRLTAGLAITFFATSLILAYMSGIKTEATSVVDIMEKPAIELMEETVRVEAETQPDVPVMVDPKEGAEGTAQ